MAQKTVLVCDVCGDEPARTVTLRVAGASWQKDLCETHVTELLNGARRPRRGVRPGTKRTERAAARTPRATSQRKATPRRQTRANRSRRRATNRDVAAQVKKLRAGGLSYRRIGETLIKEGIRPPRAKAWNRVVLARFLKQAA
jgi:hypothetical protein